VLEVDDKEAHGHILLLGQMANYLSAEDHIAVLTRLELVEGCNMVDDLLSLLFVGGEAHSLL
jgi:hypothetical protein